MNIGICHYRIGKTDGVSLEIMKRHEVLAEMGHHVTLISGSQHNGADYSIVPLEYDEPDIRTIKENAFHQLVDYASEEELLHDINRVALSIEHQFMDVHKAEAFDVLMVHNIFSHALHLPASRAFYNIAKRTELPVFAINHDFYWDPNNVHYVQPTGELMRDFVAKYFLPDLPNIKHVTISKLNQERLKEERGLDASVLPDTFDFAQQAWEVDDYNQTLLKDIDVTPHDLLVLQATRVVERKAIELSIDVVRELTKRKDELIGKTLYNGKKITKDSRIVLVLTGYTEKFAHEYRLKLDQEIKAAGIEARFADHCINSVRDTKDGVKMYSLWDSYAHADLVTYPSTWEGWGNQFIEAIFAKKPVVVFEYPVFKTDIAPEGYNVITLDDDLGPDRDNRLVTVPEAHLQSAVSHALRTLTDPKTRDDLEQNWLIGLKYHSNEVLRVMLADLLNDELVHAQVARRATRPLGG